MKKLISLLLLCGLLCVSLCACNGSVNINKEDKEDNTIENALDGAYISDDERFTIVFEPDGNCRWYQGESFFNGTYRATKSGWQLEIVGDATHPNTVFTAVAEGDDLVVNGGLCDDTLFIMQ